MIVCTDRGVAYDLTSHSLIFSVSTEEKPTTASYVFQSVGVIDDATAGTAHFPLSESDTDLIGTFYYDVEITDGAGLKRTPSKGKIIFTQDITK
jgi:hypothetical protein